VGAVLNGIEGVLAMEPVADGAPDGSACGFVLTAAADADPRSEIGRRIGEQRWSLRELYAQHETLEEIYVRMTRAEL
jgi:hypothetical protein